MKGLSLNQPWAQLVAVGAKRIETRSWSVEYRGPLAIHATKAFPQDAIADCHREPFKGYLKASGIVAPADLPRGVIVAVARLVTCQSTTVVRLGRYMPSWWPADGSDEAAFGNYGDGRYAWFLEDVRPLAEPIPCRGYQGLWDVPTDVAAAIEAQIGVARVAPPPEPVLCAQELAPDFGREGR